MKNILILAFCFFCFVAKSQQAVEYYKELDCKVKTNWTINWYVFCPDIDSITVNGTVISSVTDSTLDATALNLLPTAQFSFNSVIYDGYILRLMGTGCDKYAGVILSNCGEYLYCPDVSKPANDTTDRYVVQYYVDGDCEIDSIIHPIITPVAEDDYIFENDTGNIIFRVLENDTHIRESGLNVCAVEVVSGSATYNSGLSDTLNGYLVFTDVSSDFRAEYTLCDEYTNQDLGYINYTKTECEFDYDLTPNVLQFDCDTAIYEYSTLPIDKNGDSIDLKIKYVINDQNGDTTIINQEIPDTITGLSPVLVRNHLKNRARSYIIQFEGSDATCNEDVFYHTTINKATSLGCAGSMATTEGCLTGGYNFVGTYGEWHKPKVDKCVSRIEVNFGNLIDSLTSPCDSGEVIVAGSYYSISEPDDYCFQVEYSTNGGIKWTDELSQAANGGSPQYDLECGDFGRYIVYKNGVGYKAGDMIKVTQSFSTIQCGYVYHEEILTVP